MIIKKTKLVLLNSFVAILLAACAGVMEDTGLSAGNEAATGMAVIEGTIDFQEPSTPSMMLYVVDVDQPEHWQVTVLAEAEGMAAFSVEVDAGRYLLYARPIESPMSVAGYLNGDDSVLGTLAVAAGEIVTDVRLVFIAPGIPCQAVSVPASPDGLFPEISRQDSACIDALAEGQSAEDTSEEVVSGANMIGEDVGGTRFSGFIEFDTSTPLPESATLYMMDTNDLRKWTSFEIPLNEVVAYQYAFNVTVEPGNYVLVLWQSTDIPLGELDAENTDELKVLTIGEEQAIEDIYMGFVYPQEPCQEVTIPPSPDGKYAGIDRDAGCLGEPVEEEDKKAEADNPDGIDLSGSGTISGSISFQGISAPASTKLYLVNQDTAAWYWAGWYDGASLIYFSSEVAAGRYILFAHGVDSTIVAAHLNASGAALARVTVTDGDDIDGINLILTVPVAPCQAISIPPSPDGEFPAVFNSCN